MAAPVTIVILVVAFALGAGGRFLRECRDRAGATGGVDPAPAVALPLVRRAGARPRQRAGGVVDRAPGPVSRLRLAHPGPLPPRGAGRRPPRRIAVVVLALSIRTLACNAETREATGKGRETERLSEASKSLPGSARARYASQLSDELSGFLGPELHGALVLGVDVDVQLVGAGLGE